MGWVPVRRPGRARIMHSSWMLEKPPVQQRATRDVRATRIPLRALRAWMDRRGRGGAYSLIEMALTRLASVF